MALDFSNGPSLIASIKETIDRDDVTDTTVQGWVRLFEAQLATMLRIPEMERHSTLTVSGEYTNLPTDLLELRSVYVSSPTYQRRALSHTSTENLMDVRRAFRHDAPTSVWNYPTHFALVGNQIQIAPVPTASTVLDLVYYASIPPLSLTTNASHWLLTKAPHLYFYGAIMHAPGYLFELERIQEAKQNAIEAISGLNEAAKMAKYSGSRLIAKPRTFG